jgi:hypothetical protein
MLVAIVFAIMIIIIVIVVVVVMGVIVVDVVGVTITPPASPSETFVQRVGECAKALRLAARQLFEIL